MFSNENNNEFSAVKQQELEAVNGGLSSGDFGGAVSLPGIGGGGDLVSGGLVIVQPGAPDLFCGCGGCPGRQITICGCQNRVTPRSDYLLQVV